MLEGENKKVYSTKLIFFIFFYLVLRFLKISTHVAIIQIIKYFFDTLGKTNFYIIYRYFTIIQLSAADLF
jgi:hypothetical protein